MSHKQETTHHHTYTYTLPLEDWEIRPPEGKTTWAEMAYYPHANRLYFRWRIPLANPITKIGPAGPSDGGGTYQPTHWGTRVLHEETTFYVRDIPAELLPRPYRWESVLLRYGQGGLPTKDDPLGAGPPYAVILAERSAYGASQCPNAQSTA